MYVFLDNMIVEQSFWQPSSAHQAGSRAERSSDLEKILGLDEHYTLLYIFF